MNLLDLLVEWLLSLGYTEFHTLQSAKNQNAVRCFVSGAGWFGETIVVNNNDSQEIIIHRIAKGTTVRVGRYWTQSEGDLEIDLHDPDSLDKIRDRFNI